MCRDPGVLLAVWIVGAVYDGGVAPECNVAAVRLRRDETAIRGLTPTANPCRRCAAWNHGAGFRGLAHA